ncbi:MAG: hypothetical protein P8J20_17085 [Novosphingobium sp.]|nr:hypothetical protein [Novosphingobium sp.]
MGILRQSRSAASQLRLIFVTVAFLSGTSACDDGSPAAPDDNGEFRAITQAAFADGKLWLLEDDGNLVSVSPAQGETALIDVGGKVLDICKSQGHLAVLIDDSGTLTLKRASIDGWVELSSASSGGDRLIAMDCETDQIGAVLVTNNRLIEMADGEVRSIGLSSNIEPPYVTATALVADDAIWLGLNNGEWGGGLHRISRAGGQVETIELNRSGELCGGPLNTDCDPVNGLAASPWKPNCMMAAVGLVHMIAHGRLVEICGNTVRRLYFKPFEPQPPHNTFDDGEPASTIAFFGLARVPAGVIATGIDGIYRFNEARNPQFQSLPKFQEIDGYRVSFDIPDVVIVFTEVNARASLSGSVPLMAVR